MSPDKPPVVKLGEITLSPQLYEQTLASERAWNDVLSGRVEWDPDSVDWEALEEMYEDD